jgi:hydroxymethylpyrimidine/phosphomethylpyrimidine kinase
MKVALTIAGSDSSGGAGIQQDLKAFLSCGVHGASVLTALTAQNTRGVHRVHHVPPQFVAAQIDAVARDLPIAAAKTGMLGRAQVVEVVAERVRRRQIPRLVVDPVMLAKDGTPLLSARGVALLKSRLLPRAMVVTPNIPEAEALSGVEIRAAADLREAARRIQGLGVPGVIIKGGHLPGEPVDTLLWNDEWIELAGRRIAGAPVHGTGCLFSALLAARLALGDSPPDACGYAHGRVARAIETAAARGKGSRLVVLDPEAER